MNNFITTFLILCHAHRFKSQMIWKLKQIIYLWKRCILVRKPIFLWHFHKTNNLWPLKTAVHAINETLSSHNEYMKKLLLAFWIAISLLWFMNQEKWKSSVCIIQNWNITKATARLPNHLGTRRKSECKTFSSFLFLKGMTIHCLQIHKMHINITKAL